MTFNIVKLKYNQYNLLVYKSYGVRSKDVRIMYISFMIQP